MLFSLDVFSMDSTFYKIKDLISKISSDSLAFHIRNLEKPGGMNSRINFTPGNDSAKEYIQRAFSGFGGNCTISIDTFYIPSAAPPLNTKPLFNIEVTFPGRLYPDSVFILGAHYDCSASRMGSEIWSSQWDTITAPGADDNATGIAALLEICRVLSDSNINFQNDYTIKLVAFGAEESGPAYSGSHNGSLNYVQKAAARHLHIMGMVSIDMIGYNDNYLYNSIISNAISKFLGTKAYDLNRQYHTELILPVAPFIYGEYSDHLSFWNSGIPAICFMENAPPWNNGTFYNSNPYYHTSYDSLGTVNITLVKNVTKLCLALAASISKYPALSEEETNNVSNYTLSQNYPNPFNSSTVINYTLPKKEKVNITIFDILGNEIAELLNEEKNAGSYSIRFNTEKLSSGIYFYILKTGVAALTRKMVLLK
jgi:hypothetical protein